MDRHEHVGAGLQAPAGGEFPQELRSGARTAPPRSGRRFELLERNADPLLTFATLVPFRVNEFTLEIAAAVSRSASRTAFNPLYVYSDVGMGKTHLLSAIANATHGRTVAVVNTADLLLEFRRACSLGARAELRVFLTSMDMLLLDDVQECEGDHLLQEELFAVLNHMLRDGRVTVIASDVPPTRLREIEHRLLSRLGAGAIVGLQMGSREERRALIRSLPGSDALSEEVIGLLASEVRTSVRQLKAAASQVIAYRDIRGAALPVERVRDLIAQCTALGKSRSEVRVPAPSGRPQEPAVPLDEVGARAVLREMLAQAQGPEEQRLAVEIGLAERLRQVRAGAGPGRDIATLERALDAVRTGNLEQAVAVVAGLAAEPAPMRGCREAQSERAEPPRS